MNHTANTEASDISMHDIEELTKQYATAREALAGRVRELEEEMQGLKRRYLPGIKRALGTAGDAETRLREAIDAAPHLFKSPRTRTFHDVRVGIVKGKGGITWQNDDRVCQLIRKQFPDQAETLIKVTEKPVKKALNNLSSQQLKKLGVSIVEAGDEIFVKAVDGDIDKLVDALLADVTEVQS